MLTIRTAFVTRVVVLSAALSCSLTACGRSGPTPEEVAQQFQGRVASLERAGISVRDERMLERGAVAKFYQDRQTKAAWEEKDRMEIVNSIRGFAADGLDPADYHLKTIEALLEQRKTEPTAEIEGDLDVLLTDAVAGMVDHMRYGRVRPVTLNPAWNVDPREDAPPLDQTLREIQASGNVAEALAGARPNHFIYQGLVKELARLKEIAAKGGWPAVPAGKSIKPGAVDPRVPSVRARLAASGEFQGESGSDPTRYEERLVDAVKAFQAHHRLNEDGIVDKGTVAAMNIPVEERIGQVMANMERSRWVLHGLSDEFMLVNIPAFKAYLIRGGRNIWEARTQVGEEGKETPTFRAMMRTVVLNPDWTVPQSIIVNEIMPAMAKGRNVLAQQGLRAYDENGNEVSVRGDLPDGVTLKQPPGPKNALGKVKFLFPNKFAIYLHDTPNKRLFDNEVRTFSHGCIRLQNAMELAEVLLGQQGWGPDRIQEALASGETKNVNLEHPIPVLIVYWTVSVGATGEVRYGQDIYNQDPGLVAALTAPPRRA